MKKLLPTSVHLNSFFQGCLTLFMLMIATNATKAQVINETFEEAIWTSGTNATNATVSGSGSGQIIMTATSANQTITYYTAYQQSTATATSLNTAANSGTWFYNKASAGSSTYTRLSKARSLNNWMGVSSGGYIVTPIVVNGVATVVFSVNVTTDFAVGLYTNTTAPGQPTHLSVGTSTGGVYTIPTAYTYASQVFMSSSLTTYTVATNTGTGTAVIGNSAQLVTFTGTFTGPCRVGIFNLMASGLGIDDITITANSTTPVSFGAVTALQKSNGINVQWNVVAEVNTEKYIVEKSSNGKDFTEAVQINATNNRTYNWLDAVPLTGNSFYRIKALDKDGKVGYSSIVKVNKGKSLADINIYPNPVTNGQLHLQMNEMDRGGYQLIMHDMEGRKVLAATINHEGGSSAQSISLPAWIRKGSYTIQVLNNEMKLTKTVLVE